jgi:hypothetical protein
MEFLVALQYPNGRIHETVYHDETVYHATPGLETGAEFQMYGHRWRVVGLLEKPHHSHLPAAQPPRFLCVPVADFLHATG